MALNSNKIFESVYDRKKLPFHHAEMPPKSQTNNLTIGGRYTMIKGSFFVINDLTYYKLTCSNIS